MTVGKIQDIKLTQRGNWMLTVETESGAWGPFFSKDNLSEFSVGSEIEFRASDQKTGTQGPYWWMNDVKPVGYSQATTPTAGTAPQVPPVVAKDQSEAMFVTRVVSEAMSSGKFEASDIIILTLAAREAFKAPPLASTPPISDPQAPPDDDIPF